jgi:hypothetical protein
MVFNIHQLYNILRVNKYNNKMENEKYHTVGAVPKSNIKIVEMGLFDTPNTQMHDRES